MEVRGPPNNDLEKAKLLYSKTIELEKQLRNELKKKSPLDRSIALLRNNIRDNYEQILFLNYDFAMSKEVEQAIWKSVFYRVIEEFRKRLRKFPQPNGVQQQSPQQQQPQHQQAMEEEQKRIGSSFKQFLTSAMNFYQRLLCKLQATFHLTLDGSVSYRLHDEGLVKLHRSYLSCHRCFIFMGDLARYHKDIKLDEADTTTPPVWTRAAQYYQRALLILPDNGNPHNQLAVLATYEDDAFSGVYRYFRSLAIRQPFTTARDNLKVLFEKNRMKLESEETTDPNSVDLFLAGFVRLHGVFFTKTELESVGALKTDLLRNFAALLAKVNAYNAPSNPTGTPLNASTILKMIAMLIFTVHNVVLPRSAAEQQQAAQPGSKPPPTSPPANHTTILTKPRNEPVSEDVTQLQALAVSIAFEFVATLAHATAALHTPERSDVPGLVEYLACIGVFLEWIRMHPEFVPRTQSQASLWDALALLLNSTSKINLADASKSGTLPVLEAEAELRGFLPLHNYMKTLPQSSLVYDPNKEKKLDAAEMWNSLAFRLRKLREFAAFACGLQPQIMFYNKDTGLYSTLNYKPNTLSVPAATAVSFFANKVDDNASVEDDGSEDDDDEAAFTASKFEFVEEDEEEDQGASQRIPLDDNDVDDEVIVFRPDQNFGNLRNNGRLSATNSPPLIPSSPSLTPSPSHSPALPTTDSMQNIHSGHHPTSPISNASAAVHTRGAEFGIIGSRPKTPPYNESSPRGNGIVPTHTADFGNGLDHAPSVTSPFSAAPTSNNDPNRSYLKFDFGSFYGLNHPFALGDGAANPGPPSPSTTTPLSSLFTDARYSLFSAETSTNPLPLPLPQVIDMPFQPQTSSSHTRTQQENNQPESEAHSPTCTNRDSPFAWLAPMPLSVSNGSKVAAQPPYTTNGNAAPTASYFDSAILSSGVTLPFPFPGEPTLKFRTKNPYVNT